MLFTKVPRDAVVRLPSLITAPHETLRVEPKTRPFGALVQVLHRVHDRMQRVVIVGHAHAPQDCWVDLRTQKVAGHDIQFERVPRCCLMNILDRGLRLRLRAMFDHHLLRHDVLPRRERRIVAPSGLEVRHEAAGRHRIGVLEYDEAFARPLLHHLCVGRQRLLDEIAIQDISQMADIGAAKHPNLEGALSGKEILHGGLPASHGHYFELLRGILLLLFVDILRATHRRPHPELSSAQANAVLALHGEPRLLQ
mmetsp:Transcript_13312/g.29615  ORF Transcript_13312/g.29615 Transcript_13312/m.29615 type:complete len:253 (-) Transcript_13312:994-1752(-)